jgi:chemotaxis protein methyltransferase CheR
LALGFGRQRGYNSAMKITDFDLYKDLLKEKSGLTLTPDKSYLLDSRLTPVAKKWNFASLDAMSMTLRGMPDKKLIIDIVEAMTTNETSFFRDQKPFDNFRDVVLPHLLKERAKQKSIRIWCAAASSGQEPYSLAMLIKEQGAKLAGWKTEIVATDISLDILDKAKKGEYTQFEVQRGLPITMLVKYFEQKGDAWALKPEVRNMIKFDYFNLLDDMTKLGTFDVIFCRNVLIYFDQPSKAAVMEKMAKRLPSDGFLFLGGAETVLGITDSFKPLPNARGLYIPQASTVTVASQAAAR